MHHSRFEGTVSAGRAYEFEVGSDACEDEADALRGHQVVPFLLVLGVGEPGEFSCPVDATRLGKSVINDVVDVSLTKLVTYTKTGTS